MSKKNIILLGVVIGLLIIPSHIVILSNIIESFLADLIVTLVFLVTWFSIVYYLEYFYRKLRDVDPIDVEILDSKGLRHPEYKTPGASGMDIRYDGKAVITVNPGERVLLTTGVYVALPENYEFQVRSRSGLAWEDGVVVLNSPGTVDADYRGEIKIILINHSKVPLTVKEGDRVAQLVLTKVQKVLWVPVKALDDTKRGKGGFKSTGVT